VYARVPATCSFADKMDPGEHNSTSLAVYFGEYFWRERRCCRRAATSIPRGTQRSAGGMKKGRCPDFRPEQLHSVTQHERPFFEGTIQAIYSMTILTIILKFKVAAP
jgi:hypothetical protein